MPEGPTFWETPARFSWKDHSLSFRSFRSSHPVYYLLMAVPIVLLVGFVVFAISGEIPWPLFFGSVAGALFLLLGHRRDIE